MNFKPTRTKIITIFIFSIVLTFPFILILGFLLCKDVGCIQGMRMDHPCEYYDMFPLSCCGGGWSRECVSLSTHTAQMFLVFSSGFLITFILLYTLYSLFEKK